ncbi:mandelate racemase/muconate lactonizing enzyme family protein [Roseomonas sp. OT10]|uniref:mandelate racemase/muconate lactonizing enzyme family protein n=1 Tax=Roseomonas cutis TaxID=2897332 RepID=UPI001E544776|nr:mandelate racemase/muconate lactonizing enzyme family protein [Roseomonas sp. OT10]UFN48461.1 mandelate racemase/muconate lactonizing enzyme family protein [Roseomonas sp. OT10]
MIRIARVEAFSFRVPIVQPIKVAFGTFRDRPAVYVRVTDEDGAQGWGEAWCNWPAVGAEHRARLVADIGERIAGCAFATPAEVFHRLEAELDVLVLQTAEVGPIAQALAGLDIAVWDLFARKQGVPLYRLLRDTPVADVPVYATGINPDEPERFALARQAEGHRAFKLKIGFGEALDLRNVHALRETLGPEAELMVDANQALDLPAALRMAEALAPFALRWLEEPLRVDRSAEEWAQLARLSPVSLAGGENLRGTDLLAAAKGHVLRVVQPDITKWGGITGNAPVATEAVARGKSFCPHVFGGGVALLAALHLLAAAGGDGTLEFDCHPNAARDLVVGTLLPVRDGQVPVPAGPGLGAVPDLDALSRYRTWPA